MYARHLKGQACWHSVILLAGASSSSEPLDWMVGPPSDSDCSGASQLGGRLKPFHWEEGGLPADLETVVVFRGSWRGRREDGMESSTLGHFHASLQMRQKGSYATLLNLSKKLSLHKLSFCKQSHQFDDMAQLGEEAESSGTNRRRPWRQTLMGLETAVR